MPRTAIPSIPLYAHSRNDAISLLVGLVPHSLPVLTTLLSSTPPPGDTSGAQEREVPLPYFTFPPQTPPPEIWTTIVPLPSPQTDQIRCFNSAEPLLTPVSSVSSSSTHATSQNGSKEIEELRDEATAQVVGALLSYEKINSDWSLVGALNTVFEQAVRECLGGSKRGFCSVWLPPSAILPSVSTFSAAGASTPSEERQGWIVDIGREIDVSAVSP